MASHKYSSSLSLPHPDYVAWSFVEQYYNMLHDSPENAHTFYRELSVVGRPGSDDAMVSVTTLQGIHEKIMASNSKDHRVEIADVYAQDSYMGGVIARVAGFLTAKDTGASREFTQIFFLAKQVDGYFVLNDFLLLKKPSKTPRSPQPSTPSSLGQGSKPSTPVQPSKPSTQDQAPEKPSDLDSKPPASINVLPVQPLVLSNPAQIAKLAVVSKPQATAHVLPAAKPAPNNGQQDGEASYQSTATVEAASAAVNFAPVAAPAKSVVVRVALSTDHQLTAMPECKAAVPPSANGADDDEELKVVIKSLAPNVSADLLIRKLKKFGPVKPQNVQFRNNTATVKFESTQSVSDAAGAYSIQIHGKECRIEKLKQPKKPPQNANNNTGKSAPSSSNGGTKWEAKQHRRNGKDEQGGIDGEDSKQGGSNGVVNQFGSANKC
ncbi:hypothetical protein RJ639_029782 [Escallonia herrerae]|uniref:NTF2 domain-containing protein n=1 Tax=Escallonia herrerae TaxID=1293975 RepID=A0AA88X3B7_9ASTE|nr:hypothetical protein RJ639_029782 [Escallonia herrerae]